MGDINAAINLFHLGVQTLGHIQLARELQDDFETHQLKLDIIQLRLSRWGEVVGFTTIDIQDKNPIVPYRTAIDSDLPLVMSVLDGICDRLHKAKREADRFRKELGISGAQGLDPASCMPMDLMKIRNRIRESLNKRKVQASKAVECIKWVFYKKEHFDKFVVSISELIDGLEKLLKDDVREKLLQLSHEECKGISKSNLEELKDIIDECDPWLQSSVEAHLNSRGAETVINQSRNSGHVVGIHRGDNKGNSYGTNSQQTNTFH